jgi:hypothetical protein
MVCGKRTMCRVPRCRAETSKHVTYSCGCTRRKVHCWIRKCKPAQNMNWVQARHWHAVSHADFSAWHPISSHGGTKSKHDTSLHELIVTKGTCVHSKASSVSAQRRTPMKAAPVLQPRVRRRWQIGKVATRVHNTYVARCQCNYGGCNYSISRHRAHAFEIPGVFCQCTTANTDDRPACPTATGLTTMTNRKSTWPEKYRTRM